MRSVMVMMVASIWIALFLMFLPMPTWAVWFRPAWVLLVLMYWVMSYPSRMNMGIAFFLGLLVDLLSGTILGEHALAYTLVAYWVNRMHLRIRLYTLPEQGFFVFGCVLFYLFILYCVQGVLGELPSSPWYWSSALTSTILWPWCAALLKDLCRRCVVTSFEK